MRKIFISLVLAASLAIVSGCAAPAPLPTPTPSVQFDVDWFLSSGTDSQGAWVDGGEGAIRVSIKDGQVSGQICNNWGGDIVISGSDVEVSSIYSTKMHCTEPKGIMDREMRFLNDLSLVTSIELVDGQLRLTGDAVTLEFVQGD